MTRIQQQERTRERLLTAAGKIFSRLGYEGASIDLIAAEAGFSKGAVYSNFDSKEAIFLELLRLHMERDTAELDKICQLRPDQLSSAGTAWLETMPADINAFLLATELQLHARRNPVFGKKYYALQDEQTQALAKLLESYFKALAAPLPMDSLDLAAAFIAIANGLYLLRPPLKPGTPNPGGPVIDALLKRLMGYSERGPLSKRKRN